MHLLPPNSTSAERALSLATARVASVPVPIKPLWSPWDCPVDLLPWLAWSLSVDPWDAGWDEQQKRATIAASIDVHRRKGTIGALRRALSALGYEITITENVDGPYTFRLTINTNNTPLADTDAYAEVIRVALKNKNARSALSNVGANTEVRATLSVMTAVCYHQSVTIPPPPRAPYFWGDGTPLNWGDGTPLLS